MGKGSSEILLSCAATDPVKPKNWNERAELKTEMSAAYKVFVHATYFKLVIITEPSEAEHFVLDRGRISHYEFAY